MTQITECSICAEHLVGELLIEHYNKTKCSIAKQRLAAVGLL